jgi:hypothetical protein
MQSTVRCRRLGENSEARRRFVAPSAAALVLQRRADRDLKVMIRMSDPRVTDTTPITVCGATVPARVHHLP